jgi:ribosomal protein S18 acetylase RimI-like enzyme
MVCGRLKVSYLELREPPATLPGGAGAEGPVIIGLEMLSIESYLDLYRRVGAPYGWDSRLKMARAALQSLLSSGDLHIYLARSINGEALGFCEFDRASFPVIELKNFGLVPKAQGQRIGPRLLCTSLQHEWASGPERIWLHTDTWDHPAALLVYERAGFRVYDVRYELPESL